MKIQVGLAGLLIASLLGCGTGPSQGTDVGISTDAMEPNTIVLSVPNMT